MEMIYKTFRIDVKSVNEETGEVDMLIPMSTASVDRDRESIDPMGWKKSLPAFKKRPVLLSSHDYHDLRKQIGEFTTIRVNADGLFAKPKYYINEGNEEADWAFKLASKGVAAYSVGFMPIKWTDGDGEKEPRRTYTEQELLEISHVVVPSNRDAIQSIRSKSTDPVICKLCDDAEKEVKAEYNCECIECGHKLKSEKHCQDIKCPECGGEMRRAERPGTGKEAEDIVTKPEETDDFIRIPVRSCEVTATIDISKKEGISALYCGEEKQVRTYLFRKDHDWTMAKAKSWVKEHEKKTAHEVSQSEIIDEIDYLINLINTEGLNEEAKKAAETLVMEIERVSGNDIPVEIENITPVAVDNTANDERLKLIISQTVKNVIKEIK